jgi:hypothetical protein
VEELHTADLPGERSLWASQADVERALVSVIVPDVSCSEHVDHLASRLGDGVASARPVRPPGLESRCLAPDSVDLAGHRGMGKRREANVIGHPHQNFSATTVYGAGGWTSLNPNFSSGARYALSVFGAIANIHAESAPGPVVYKL